MTALEDVSWFELLTAPTLVAAHEGLRHWLHDADPSQLLPLSSTRVVAETSSGDYFSAQIQTDAIGNLGAISWRDLSRVLTATIERYRSLLPEFAVTALDVARSYWRDDVGTADRLTVARVACWQYMRDKNGNSVTIADDEDRCLRALISALFPVVTGAKVVGGDGSRQPARDQAATARARTALSMSPRVCR